MKKAIIGFGSFAKDVYCYLKNNNDTSDINFFVDDNYTQNECRPLSDLNFDEYEIVVAIANPQVRYSIVKKLPTKAKYFTIIHKSALIIDETVKIGEGSIICPNVVLTRHINLGKHSQVNVNSAIGHDTITGDYFTTAPGAKVSGNCNIGKKVYIGTNASIKEKIKICDDVIIGLNAGVIKNIEKSGTYVGCPAKMLEN